MSDKIFTNSKIATFLRERSLLDSMKAHDYSKFPNGKVNIALDGKHIYTILDCLFKIHAALIKEIANEENGEDLRRQAADAAYDMECVYSHIMNELKLQKGDREDLN